MKRVWKVLSLALIVMMLLSVTALGAGTTETDKATIEVKGAGVTAVFNETNSDIINVTVTSENLVVGQQYVVLMVKGTDDKSYTITSDSILYIDQTAATAATEEGKGTISFAVYPSSIQSSIILIAGAGVNGERGPLVAAIVEGNYILGDVDGNGVVNVGDVTLLLRYLVSLETADKLNLDAANVDGNDVVNVGDATKLLRVLVNLDTLDN